MQPLTNFVWDTRCPSCNMAIQYSDNKCLDDHQHGAWCCPKCGARVRPKIAPAAKKRFAALVAIAFVLSIFLPGNINALIAVAFLMLSLYKSMQWKTIQD